MNPFQNLPHSDDAESAVLCGIMLDNQAIDLVREHISAADFYRQINGLILGAMEKLLEQKKPVDLITLSDVLSSRSEFGETGCLEILMKISNATPSASNIEHYAKIIKEKSLARKLIVKSGDIATMAAGDQEIMEVLDQAQQSIFQISQARSQKSFVHVKDVMMKNSKVIEVLAEKKEIVTGVPTGFNKLDRLSCGLQPSDLIILAGRPSMGKTALALNIAIHAALRKKIPTAFFSLEMSSQQLGMRLISQMAKVDATKLRSGFLAREDWPLVHRAMNEISMSPLFIDDTPGISTGELRARARRLRASENIGLVVIDYLQLMTINSKANSNREQEISGICRQLKGLAKDLNVPVMALSQLSRQVEQREDKRPKLFDLRESGSIEQDADVVMFVYREEAYKPSTGEAGKAEIIMAKQRNGPLGMVPLVFLDKYTSFESIYEENDDGLVRNHGERH